MAQANGFDLGGYRLALGAAGLRLTHGERPMLDLPGDFVVARRGRAWSPEVTPYSGSVNLRHEVDSEARSIGSPRAMQEDSGALVLAGDLSDGGTWQLRLWPDAEGVGFTLEAAGYDEVGFCFAAAAGERFMGFGEQFTYLDMSGKAFALCVTEQGIGRGTQPLSALVNLVTPGAAGDAFTTYAPMPVFVTSRGRAMCFDQQSLYWFDVKRKHRQQVCATVWGGTLSGHWFGGRTPLELIEKHTAVTGRLSPLPAYAYGSILGVRGGREAAEKVLAECEKRGAVISALWLEDWQGKRGKNGGPPLWWRWLPDEALYPDFKNWVKDLNARGIAVMGYANPMLSADDGNPLYVEARDNRYLVQNADGSDFVSHFYTGAEFKFVLVDLTNPAAYAWLKERMRRGMVENGLTGWMADYGEYIPLYGKVHGGDTVHAHCALPVLWARLNAELIEECGLKGKVLAFHRSAGTGSNRYATVYWAGDQNPTFDKNDGLASAITGLLTSGISGMSINHTDIGGYTTLITPVFKLVRKKEVLLRWLEFAAFTPIYRTHDGSISNPLNYQFYDDEDGYAAYARMGRVHAALGWYLRELEAEATSRGWPMVRALCLHHPADEECLSIQDQYLLGEDILVSPVYAFGKTRRRAYLPTGAWVCPHSGETWRGGAWHDLPAPLGQPPVLVRAQSPRAARLLETLKSALES